MVTDALGVTLLVTEALGVILFVSLRVCVGEREGEAAIEGLGAMHPELPVARVK